MAQLRPLPQAPLDIASLARSPIGYDSLLPAEPGVYLAIDDANRVWYVGTADSIRDRIAGHDRMEDFKRSKVTSIAWKPEDGDPRRRQLEEKLIKFHHPPLNSQHNHAQAPLADFGLSREQEIDRFLQLRLDLRWIEAEMEALKPNIVTRCEMAGGKIEHPLGSIRVQAYKSWKYSEELESLKQELQQKEQEEKQNGVAKVKAVTMSPVVRLKAEATLQEAKLLPEAV